MPRVHYMRPMQGFRPYTNPERAVGLKGLGSSNVFSGCVQAYDSQSNPVSCDDPSAAVWVDANGNAVPASTATAQGAGVPSGSYLSYSGQWPITLTKSLDSVMQAVISFARSQGISITKSQPNIGLFDVHSFPVQLELLITGSGFAQPNDVRSIIDHACYLATGTMPYSSSIAVVSIPASQQAGQAAAQGYTPPPSSTPPLPQSLTQWFESNALWIGLGIAAIVVLPKVL